ncbi:transcriptional regulator, ArsR family protein, partial [mine drainage metagenome]
RVSQPGVSKQLRILKEGGMVSVRRDGRRRLYSVRGDPLREATRWLGFYAPFWEGRLTRMDGLLAAEGPRKRAKRR